MKKQNISPRLEGGFLRKKYFWNIFRKKKTEIRKGAMSPEKVKKTINEIGANKIIEITRIGYDGEIDDMPLMAKIIDISDDYFTVVVINPERSMIEDSTSQTVYAKKGGGRIEFNYDDGDIYSLEVSKDEEELKEAKDIEMLKEMVIAMDKDDPVLVCYWDAERRGVINVQGIFMDKSDDNKSFLIHLTSVNNIELEEKRDLNFNLDKDLVIDIQYAG